MPQGTTYSFLDTVATFVSPIFGTFSLGGGLANGIGEFRIINATDRTSHNVSSDGVVLVNYIAGSNGTLEISMQQTSGLHKFLVGWYNALITAADAGDVSQWASSFMTITNIVDGSQHNLSGISPLKVPDKTYGKENTNLTWHLMVAQMSQVSL